MTRIKAKIDQFLENRFPKGSKVETILLKLFLRHREKRLFQLIAPEDKVRTNSGDGYLFTQGWWSSWQKKWCTNSNGESMPWFTYPAIHFLEKTVKKEWSILEFGGGSSTVFWGLRCQNVTTIEHNFEWLKKLEDMVDDNVRLIYKSTSPIQEYINAASPKKQFDIVVIDGRNRAACCHHAPAYISPNGVIILDDSQRDRYREGIASLHKKGFREIAFFGLRHQATNETATSIFYRDNNCLNI